MEQSIDRAKLPGRRGLPRQFNEPDISSLIKSNDTNNRKCSC